jgi:hypothetical protein
VITLVSMRNRQFAGGRPVENQRARRIGSAPILLVQFVYFWPVLSNHRGLRQPQSNPSPFDRCDFTVHDERPGSCLVNQEPGGALANDRPEKVKSFIDAP